MADIMVGNACRYCRPQEYITFLEQQVDSLYRTIDRVHSGVPPITLADAVERINSIRLDKSEFFLKAWVQQFKLMPSEAILHTQVKDGTILNWVEPKNKGE
jgi:hypothetical protein